ncbi:hypothetical protein GF354_05880 [Candidatus Peregrinibacteria bacterium]|nr:hypothetical protein [Candidatus Peregrinibacteria bacterium]
MPEIYTPELPNNDIWTGCEIKFPNDDYVVFIMENIACDLIEAGIEFIEYRRIIEIPCLQEHEKAHIIEFLKEMQQEVEAKTKQVLRFCFFTDI